MRLREILLFAGMFCLFTCVPASAQYGRGKWEVTPFVGYETDGSFPLNTQTIGVNVNDLRVNGAISFGTFIDFSLTPEFSD